MVPLFVFNLFNASSLIHVDNRMPVAAICISRRLLGRVSELQKGYQIFAALGFGHA
jgi:hypothetical protein